MGLCLAGCGARSQLTDLLPEDAGPMDAEGSIDARLDRSVPDATPDALTEVELDPQVFGVYWFDVPTGAPRYFAVGICSNERSLLLTSFNGDGLPDMPSPTVGRVTPLDASFAVVSFDLAEGRWSLTVQYTEDGLRVLDEMGSPFPGLSSGFGRPERPDFIPDMFEIDC